MIAGCAGAVTAAADGSAPSFTFTTDESGATWQCALDNAPMAACASPQALTGLAPGQHTFTATSTFTVPVPSPPTAAFSFSPTNPAAGQSVHFDGTASTCPAGTCTYGYEDASGATLITGQSGDYTFSSAGTQQVTLTVTDQYGQTNTVKHDVVVSNPAVAPSNTNPPSISGSTQQGSTLTADPGTWTGDPTPKLSYQWNRGGTAISGATSNTYALVAADVGANITVTVTGANTAGTAQATSKPVGPITALPTNTCTTSKVLSGKQSAFVDSGTVGLTPDEYGSTAPFAITNCNDKANFTVTNDTATVTSTAKTVTAYPQVWVGCRWGLATCTPTNDPFPLQLSKMQPGQVPISVQSITPASATGHWNDFFDIFYSKVWPPATWGRNGGLEMGIRLDNNNYNGSLGTVLALNWPADGHNWDVGYVATNHILKFRDVNQTPNASFSGDLYPFVKFALDHGQLQPSWFLYKVSHGFEMTSGATKGVGDATFSVAGRGG